MAEDEGPAAQLRRSSPQSICPAAELPRDRSPRRCRAGFTLSPILLFILVSSLSAPVRATTLRLTLTDGSVIAGEIESVQDGIYTVRSPSLGTITVKDSDIRRIETPTDSPAGPDSTAPGPGATSHPQLDALQRQILNDDAAMSSVTALQDDPQFQDILNDPDISEALRAGDLDALARNPKLQSLMNNPKVQEINRQLMR
jgi:hypothetical protein